MALVVTPPVPTRSVDGVMNGCKLKHLQRQLETQRVIYLNTLEELFTGIVSSDAERALLINDPSGPRWKRKDYETLLHERGMLRGRNFGKQFRPGATSD